MRHRGKSPRQAAFFFRSPELQFHAANLASLFVLYGLLRATSQGGESSVWARSNPVLCFAGVTRLIGNCTRRQPSPSSTPGSCSSHSGGETRLRSGAVRSAECGGVRVHDLLAKRGSACLICAPGNVLSG
jgi:hypothetical protein